MAKSISVNYQQMIAELVSSRVPVHMDVLYLAAMLIVHVSEIGQRRVVIAMAMIVITVRQIVRQQLAVRRFTIDVVMDVMKVMTRLTASVRKDG
jgi:hypothetical protein